MTNLNIKIAHNIQVMRNTKTTVNFHSNVSTDFDTSKFDIATFDDGLYCQIDTIKELSKKLPVYFFPSGFLTRTKEYCFVENSLAHNTLEKIFGSKEYLEKDHYCFNTFMTQDEIESLIQHPNVFFGVHGWFHLNLDKVTVKQWSLIVKDATLTAEYYLSLIKKYPNEFIIDNTLHLNYACPYNVLNDTQKLWITIFLKEISKHSIYKNIELIVFSHERIEYENLTYSN